MATSESIYYLTQIYYDGTKYVSRNNTAERTYAITYDSEQFSDGDVIYVSSPQYSLNVSYIGHGHDGFIGTGQFGSTYYIGPHLLRDGETVDFRRESWLLCFLTGTMIATATGERPVQDLIIGDLVLTIAGDMRAVRWVGRQEVASLFADRQRSFPIHIQPGALGEGLPVRDLFVSPEHALLVDGLLVQAGALVNGATIHPMKKPPERFTYYHIELEDHDLILAEGVAAETFVDNVTRSRFDNYAEYVALYGEAPAVTGELEAPRVKSPRQLPAAIKARLAARVALLQPQADAA